MYLGSFSVDFISPSIAGIWVSPCIPCASQKRHCGRKGRCQHHYQFFHFSFLPSRASCLHIDTLGAGKRVACLTFSMSNVRHRQTPLQNMIRRHATRTLEVHVAQLRISLCVLWRSFTLSDDTLLRTLPGPFGISGFPGGRGTIPRFRGRDDSDIFGRDELLLVRSHVPSFRLAGERKLVPPVPGFCPRPSQGFGPMAGVVVLPPLSKIDVLSLSRLNSAYYSIFSC